jgi:hypothetical protein
MFQHAAKVSFNEVEQQLKILDEAELLVEVEDIYDELFILRKVLQDQQNVTEELSKLLDPLGLDRNQQPKSYTRQLSVKENRLLETHLQRIDNMEKMTDKNAKTVRLLYLDPAE